MTGSNVPSAPIASSSIETSTILQVEIDRSCRMPVLFFFISAAVWLVLGLALALIASLKLSLPEFLSHRPWLTFGRIQPASVDALVYGFAIQAAWGSSLWMIARLGRTRLYGPQIVTIAAALWNLGVTVGISAILAGENSGYELLEFPGYASSFLFIAYALIGLCGMVTFSSRRERQVYVSQWFLFAGLLWFAWIYSTAELLLIFFPVRGVVQSIVAAWFAHNLLRFWLASAALATLFYFIPKLLDRPLYSRGLAAFGFWLFVLAGGWGGLFAGMPVPKWYTAVSTFMSFMMIVPLIAATMNFYLTAKGVPFGQQSFPGKFIGFAAFAYVVFGPLDAITALRPLSYWVRFTEFANGLFYLGLFGFFGMAMFGAIYYIVPRLTLEDWASERLIQVHYWITALGIGLSTVALCIGGLVQGAAINSASLPFLQVVGRTAPFLAATSFGIAALLVGSAAFVINLCWTSAQSCLRSCFRRDCFADAEMESASPGAMR